MLNPHEVEEQMKPDESPHEKIALKKTSDMKVVINK